MKTSRIICLFIALAAISACGPKKINVKDSQFDKGNMADLVNISSSGGALSLQKAGEGTVVSLSLDLSLVTEAPQIKGYGKEDYAFRNADILSVVLTDANGAEVTTLALAPDCVDSLVNLIRRLPGDKVSARFERTLPDASQAKEVVKKTSSCVAGEASYFSVRKAFFGPMNLVGKIAGGGVHMSLDFKNNFCVGQYYYDSMRKQGYQSTLRAFGSLDSRGNMAVIEFNDKNKMTGFMTGTVTGDRFKGKFMRAKDAKEFWFDLAFVDEEDGFIDPADLESAMPSFAESFSENGYTFSSPDMYAGTSTAQIFSKAMSTLSYAETLYEMAMEGRVFAASEYFDEMSRAYGCFRALDSRKDVFTPEEMIQFIKLSREMAYAAADREVY